MLGAEKKGDLSMLVQWVDNHFDSLSQGHLGRTIIHLVAMVNDRHIVFHFRGITHEFKEITMAFHQITDGALKKIIANLSRDDHSKPLVQPDDGPRINEDGDVFIIHAFEKKEDK